MSILPKVTKYQIYDSMKPILIYYLIILSLVALVGFSINSFSTASISVSSSSSAITIDDESGSSSSTLVIHDETIDSTSLQNGGHNVSASGLETSTIIFLFVLGLNLFKTSFKLMSANGVTRHRFFRENILAASAIAGILTIIDTVLSLIFKQFVNYQHLYEQLYHNDNVFKSMVWFFLLYCAAIMIGWLITMLYYRSNALLKLAISISPAIILISLTYLNNLVNGRIFSAIGRLFIKFWGMETLNSYVAAQNLLLFIVLLCPIIYLLIRRAPIKN